MTRKSGFTIVELLIVIVVIGILAALVLNSFAGAQAKARNSQKISAVNAYQKILRAYAVQFNAYPPFGDAYCLGEGYPDVNGDGIGDCWTQGTAYRGVESTAFNNELKKISPSLPSPDKKRLTWVTDDTGWSVGIVMNYWGSMTVDGASKPYRLWYNLEGSDQDCGTTGVVARTATSGAYVTAQKNTGYNATTTECIISLPNPKDV